MPSNTLSADVPTLGWWFGGQEPTSRSVPIWSKLIDNMGEAYRARLEKDPLLGQSGLFIDTPSAFTNATLGQTKENRSRYPLLQQAVEVFDGEFFLPLVQPRRGFKNGRAAYITFRS